VTAEHLRALADQLDAEALAEARAGRIDIAALKGMDAEKFRRTAAEMERVARGEPLPEVGVLPNAKQSGKVGGMNSVQAADRAQAISKAKAGKDPFLRAVSKSKWRSMNRYARQRLKKSPGMLTAYRQGTYPVPDDIQSKIFEDFGLRIGRSE
jgi:hypothetical protein